MNPLKVRVAFSKPAHAARAQIGQPGANHAAFTAKPNSYHVHSTLRVTPSTSPCPTLSVDAEPARQRTETFCIVHSNNVIKSAL